MRTITLLTLSLAVLAAPLAPSARAGIQVPGLGDLPQAPTKPRLWFDGTNATAVVALKARITNPATSGYYASFKEYVDSRLASIANGSATDDTRSKLAKAAALLYQLGATPPTGAGYASYRDAARVALAGVHTRVAVNTVSEWFNPPDDAINVLQDSSRLQSMAEAYDLLRGSGISSGHDSALRNIVANWANALRDDWNLTGAYNVIGAHRDNWGIKGGAALVTAALAMPTHGDAASWKAAGMTFLNESLDAVASTTGWFFESPWYLNYSLANLVPTAYHVKNAMGVSWWSALRPLVATALVVRQPDGRAPPFEEGLPNTFPYDVLATAYPDLAATLKWAWSASPQNAENFDNQQIHSVTRFIVADITTAPAAPTSSPTRTVGSDAFIAVLASGHGADALSVSTITARDRFNFAFTSGHNFQNPLDVVLHARGTLLLPTSGGGPTVTTSEHRSDYLDPRERNLPLVGRSAPFVTDATAVSFGDRLDSADTTKRPNHFADLVSTSVSAYDGASLVRRTLALIDLDYVAVFDRFQSNSDSARSFEAAWRGRGPRTDLGSTATQVRERWTYGGERLRLDVAGSGTLSLQKNDTRYADAWGSEEAIEGVFVGTSAQQASLVSVFQPLPGPPDPGTGRTVTALTATGGAAVTVVSGATSDTLIGGPGRHRDRRWRRHRRRRNPGPHRGRRPRRARRRLRPRRLARQHPAAGRERPGHAGADGGRRRLPPPGLGGPRPGSQPHPGGAGPRPDRGLRGRPERRPPRRRPLHRQRGRVHLHRARRRRHQRRPGAVRRRQRRRPGPRPHLRRRRQLPRHPQHRPARQRRRRPRRRLRVPRPGALRGRQPVHRGRLRPRDRRLRQRARRRHRRLRRRQPVHHRRPLHGGGLRRRRAELRRRRPLHHRQLWDGRRLHPRARPGGHGLRRPQRLLHRRRLPGQRRVQGRRADLLGALPRRVSPGVVQLLHRLLRAPAPGRHRVRRHGRVHGRRRVRRSWDLRRDRYFLR
jgi:hypothetical protein